MKWTVVLIWLAVIVGALFYDHDLIFWMESHRIEWLNPWMIFLTDYGLLFGLCLFFLALFEKHLTKQIILITLAFCLALEASYVLKMIFEAPRPYITWDIFPLKSSEGFSFPSMHATFIFSALPFFRGYFKRYVYWWAAFAFLVAFSRFYVGVHYLSDVIAGGLLGYGIGALLYYLEEEFGLATWFNQHIKDRFEFRRQIAHAGIGSAIIFFHFIGLLPPETLLLTLVIGGCLSLLSLFVDVPLLSTFLKFFERPHHHKTFPGRGAFFLVLGALISILLFPKDIALAAIAIMAFGDSVTNIFGRHFGEVKLPYNKRKTIDGALMGVAAATMAAFFFVPLPVALIASLGAIFVETLDLKIGWPIDDNLIVPIVAGGIMMILL
jgi:dolichol kinase